MNNKPLVSIACIAYNHEKYIKDAIEGFLSQKTDFDYEIIIHDDASSDRTADIIRQYEARYPDKIHGIYQKENQFSKIIGLGIIKNYVYPICRGKYIALSDGDDFWVDVNKLQLQVDFMESHPECMITSHDAVCMDYRDFTIYPLHPYHEERYLSDEEVIIQYHDDIPTASMLCRKDILNLEGFFMSQPGDYSIELHAITKGKIYFSPRIMSVYRVMHEGSWSHINRDNIERTVLVFGKVISFLRQYDEFTNGKYHQEIIYKESLFIKSSSYSINKSLNTTIDEIEKFLKRCNEKSGNQYEKYFQQLELVYRQMYEEDYCPVSIKTFVEHYDYIYIWGAGKYGQRVAKQLMNIDRDFEAFVVSESTQEKVMEKSVIGLEEIPYPMEKVGIIVAVSVKTWGELWKQFGENEELHYIFPYGVTEII